MSLPIVTIVGRPNVGKSSLLNMLARERISIVDPRAGITRDRVSALIEYHDRWMEIIDTGGVGIVDDDNLETHVEDQIQQALVRADLILFVVDVFDGVTPLDVRVAELLRKINKPTLLVANKVDDHKHESEAAHFVRLGFGEALPIAAAHARGREALLGAIFARLGDAAGDAPVQPVMKLAIVGKRNAGKSTLVNALAGEERMIVSEVPGTTRDAVDVTFEKNGQQFIAIDTAGVRKKSRMSDVDFYSYTRALRSIQRADVVLLLIDATVPIADPDLKLAEAILAEHKPVVLSVNKWDLAKDHATADQYGEYLTKIIPWLDYAPITFMTARDGRNVNAAVEVAQSLFKQSSTRVGTGRLNAALEEMLAARGPSAKHGTRPVRIYYATQIAVNPPTIVFFCNDPALVREEYRRYMQNRLREILPFREVPVRLMFRGRGERAAPGSPAALQQEVRRASRTGGSKVENRNPKIKSQKSKIKNR